MKLPFSTRCLAMTSVVTILLMSAGFAYAATAPSKPAVSSQTSGAITIDTVLNKLQERFANIKDISGIVDLEQVTSDGAIVKAQTTVKSRMPNLLRLQFVKPETFAGAIYVIDRKTNQVMQYSPITEQVIISGIDQVISERFVPTTVEQLFSLPSPEDYNLTIVGTETKGNQTLINVSAKPKKNTDNTTFSFWIDQSQWFVQRMKVYGSDGKLLFTINLSDIKTNQNLTEAALKKMPPGAMMIYR